MNTKPLLEKLSDNWPVKAICFVLACMIYFFHQVSLLETKTFSVPLEVRKEGNMIPVNGLQNERYITVKVRTRKESLSSVLPSDLKAYIDVSSRTKEGLWNFPVCMELSEKLIQMNIDPLEISCSPDSLKLEIQKKESKLVPLTVEVYGKPAYGYKNLDVKLDPSHVYLSGPKFMLDEIEEIPVGSINIEGSEYAVSKVMKPVNPNGYVSILDTSVVKVMVPIESEAMVKELDDVEIKCNSLAENLAIESEIPKLNFVVKGSVRDIEKFRRRNMSVSIDFSSITEPGTYLLPVVVELSPAYSLVQKSLQEVSVTVVTKPVENTENNMDSSEQKNDSGAGQ